MSFWWCKLFGVFLASWSAPIGLTRTEELRSFMTSHLFSYLCIIVSCYVINIFTGSIRIGFPTWWMTCNITTITLFLLHRLLLLLVDDNVGLLFNPEVHNGALSLLRCIGILMMLIPYFSTMDELNRWSCDWRLLKSEVLPPLEVTYHIIYHCSIYRCWWFNMQMLV